VREELEFALKNFDYPVNNWDHLCEQALLRCGLDSAYLDKNPMILSGGEKRRVAIASILVYEPQLLILDEPTAGVDGAGRQTLIQTITDYARNGRTVIWVSHELDDILLYTEKCLFFDEGRLAAFGPTYDVLCNYGDMKTDILRYVEGSACDKHKIKALLRAIARKYEK
jgi:energy-coupling factor transport system ATP-binding protein